MLLPLFGTSQIPDTLPLLYKDRTTLERTLVNNVINKGLSLEINDSTESRWNSAFFALLYLNKKSPWIENRIRYATTVMHTRNTNLQRGLLELLYGHYQKMFVKEVDQLLRQTEDSKIFAMCAHYLLASDPSYKNEILKLLKSKDVVEDPWMNQLFHHLTENVKFLSILPFLKSDYLPGNVLMVSIQRKNRDYPGLVLVRDKNGKFVRNDDGSYFSVPQIARSLSGLPGYLTNGNTPEGIMRMDGYGISKAGAIGPTTNVQITLPFEYDNKHFFKDSLVTENILAHYKELLPKAFKNHAPMFESFYAGKAGRHEIIAHGTTVKPKYYQHKPYFPFTPTLGCLCTNESWDDESGMRKESDQLKLVHAVESAGGPEGYVIVININDDKKAVEYDEILPLLKMAEQE